MCKALSKHIERFVVHLTSLPSSYGILFQCAAGLLYTTHELQLQENTSCCGETFHRPPTSCPKVLKFTVKRFRGPIPWCLVHRIRRAVGRCKQRAARSRRTRADITLAKSYLLPVTLTILSSVDPTMPNSIRKHSDAALLLVGNDGIASKSERCPTASSYPTKSCMYEQKGYLRPQIPHPLILSQFN